MLSSPATTPAVRFTAACGDPSDPWPLRLRDGVAPGASLGAGDHRDLLIAAPSGTRLVGGRLERQMFDYSYTTASSGPGLSAEHRRRRRARITAARANGRASASRLSAAPSSSHARTYDLPVLLHHAVARVGRVPRPSTGHGVAAPTSAARQASACGAWRCAWRTTPPRW